MENQPSHQRLEVVDALRGFALASIIILHNIEHFDLYFHPTNQPSWLVALDKGIWNAVFWLFNGKSYGIFSLLFGFTFYLQYTKQAREGRDFRFRFAWRMMILFVFGMVNTAFFEGDILTFYAIIGLILIPMARIKTKTLTYLAAAFLINPFVWINLIIACMNPGMTPDDPNSSPYFDNAPTYLEGESATSTWMGNLTNGKVAIFYWFWETGRFMQTPALFILGMLMGRQMLFTNDSTNAQKWVKILKYGFMALIPLLVVKIAASRWIESPAVEEALHAILAPWFNFSMMWVMVATFILLWRTKIMNPSLSIFTPLGKMSLSNYLMQSVMGAYIYYGFGLGLYKYTGAGYSLLIGIASIIFLTIFSMQWLKTHKQGPAEYLWHKLTWIKCRPCKQFTNIIFRKDYTNTKNISNQ